MFRYCLHHISPQAGLRTSAEPTDFPGTEISQFPVIAVPEREHCIAGEWWIGSAQLAAPSDQQIPNLSEPTERFYRRNRTKCGVISPFRWLQAQSFNLGKGL